MEPLLEQLMFALAAIIVVLLSLYVSQLLLAGGGW